MWPNADIISDLSTFISRDFHMDVRNAFNTNLSRLKTIINDMALRHIKGIEVISAGSTTEGTETSKSDTDGMVIVPDMKVFMKAYESQHAFDVASLSQYKQSGVATSIGFQHECDVVSSSHQRQNAFMTSDESQHVYGDESQSQRQQSVHVTSYKSQNIHDITSLSLSRQNDAEATFFRLSDNEANQKDSYDSAVPRDQVNIYLATSKCCKPGYVRLTPLFVFERPTKTFLNIKNMITETAEGVFLSSEKYTVTNARMAEQGRPTTFKDFYKHGPCVTTSFQTIYGYRTERTGLDLDIDMCLAIECNEWPEEAREWITRERKHGWPSQNLIERISKLRCFVVPVGDATSQNVHLEWMVSFLLAEREMIWNLNDTQIQCYIILKMLRQSCIEPIAPDTISSYHLKTIIFWLAENEGLDEWNDANLLNCVRNCLSYLASCIEQEGLQHYLYRTNNLFRSKFRNTTEKEAVIDAIKKILDDVSYVIANGLLETSVVYEMWECEADCGRLVEMCRIRPELSDMFDVNKRANAVIRFSSSVLLLCNYLAATVTILESLLGLQEDLDCLVSPNCATKCYIELIKSFIDIRLGITSYVRAISATCSFEKELFVVRAKRSIDAGQKFEAVFSNADNNIQCFDVGPMSAGPMSIDIGPTLKQRQLLSGKLYMATFHLANGDFALCREGVLKELNTENVIVYTGRCSDNPGIITGIEDEDDLYAHVTFLPINGKPDEVVNTAIDVIISKHDVTFIPKPLQYECAMFANYGDGSFLIHPLVYAELLLFLSYFYENRIEVAKNSLRKFEEVVWDIGYTPLRYQALNIVGYCFAMISEFDRALSCYIHSLKETYMRAKVRNVAGYLMGVLITRAMSSKKDGDRGWIEAIYHRQIK